jgi:hypothetical protein
MKTIKRSDEVLRVADKKAEEMVKNQGYKYCPKSEWKPIRDAAKIEAKRRVEEVAAKKTEQEALKTNSKKNGKNKLSK